MKKIPTAEGEFSRKKCRTRVQRPLASTISLAEIADLIRAYRAEIAALERVVCPHRTVDFSTPVQSADPVLAKIAAIAASHPTESFLPRDYQI